MKLKTSRNKTFEVDYAATSQATNRLHIRLADPRALSAIARDFDGLAWVKTENADKWTDCEGPFSLAAIIRDQSGDRVSIALQKQ